jgi:hypothetical protein
MSESRDTLVLPCRHLCLCNPCAEVLRYQVAFVLALTVSDPQANKCPICRANFHSLLQLRVAQKSSTPVAPEEHVRRVMQSRPYCQAPGLPPDYRAVAIVDALKYKKPAKHIENAAPQDDFAVVTSTLLSTVQKDAEVVRLWCYHRYFIFRRLCMKNNLSCRLYQSFPMLQFSCQLWTKKSPRLPMRLDPVGRYRAHNPGVY